MARSDGDGPGATVAVSARWLAPLEAYLALQAAGERPLLLASAGAHPEARWSFIGLTPVEQIVVRGGDAWVGPLRETRGKQDDLAPAPTGGLPVVPAPPALPALAALRDAFARMSDAGPQPAPFTGGWVGYLGYEVATLFEPSIPRHAVEPSGVPDAMLWLCLDAIAFDHQAGTATVFARDEPGKPGKPGEAARRAARHADVLRHAMRGPSAGDAARHGTPEKGQAEATQPGPKAVQWATSLDAPGFMQRAATLRQHIWGGDLFQANLATRFSAPARGSPAQALRALLEGNPSPYMALLEFPGFAIASGSPELLVEARAGRVASRPIAGTRPRGATPEADGAMEAELHSDTKEQAEHTMLVDLVRNDVARVAVPGTVRVVERMAVERYRHVMHLASRVEGTLRSDTGAFECLAALFPGGTITGAPKVRAAQRIHEAEPVARGPYTGSAGYVSWDGSTAWSILIRTLVFHDGQATVHAGSGIVADSDPGREWEEAQRKAQALLGAAAGAVVGGNPTRLGECTMTSAWHPPAPPRPVAARVLLIDNYDSFVHNLADYCSCLGATTRVVRNDADWKAEAGALGATHIILGPGPGWPDEAGCTLDIARNAHDRRPILGVCLGHQALAQATGGRVKVHPDGPVHGRADPIHHTGQGLLKGLPNPLMATRYHSLVVDGLGPEWIVDARLADGTIMAMRHRDRPTYGLQFHPESLCTQSGLELVARFLEVAP